MSAGAVSTGSADPAAEPGEEPLPAFAVDVLEVVASIPPGKVLTYGDVAELLGEGGPRSVGRVMSRYGGSVPWWRVLRADGSPPPHQPELALDRYRGEGTPLRPSGLRVDMAQARWDGPG